MKFSRRLTLASLIALGVTTAQVPAFAAAGDPGRRGPASGTIDMVAKGAAVGVGYTWGDGVLRFAGHRYPFSVNGVTIADVGYSKVSGHGRVYNLKRAQDFSGTYLASTGEATLGNGIGGQILRNANGVEIRVDQITRGARLQGSADGITLTLK